MELNEIRSHLVTVEVTDEVTGQVIRPPYYAAANFHEPSESWVNTFGYILSVCLIFSFQ